MHCPYCNTINDDENSFCVSCGETISRNMKTHPNVLPPTQIFNPNQQDAPASVQTVYPPKPVSNQMPIHNQPVSYPEPPPKSGKGLIFAVVALIGLIVLGGIGVGGFYLWKQQEQITKTNEVLPDHIGMFVQNAEKTAVSEIKKLDITNVLDQKEKLLSDESLTAWEENASLILFSDGKDIPVTDLKLIQLDTIEDDGNLKQIDFQAAPIEGNSTMKRLRVPNGIANGKYAFALFNGFLNEGNHKLWAFQVKNSKKSNNDDIAKTASISVKELEKSDDKNKNSNTETAVKKDTPAPPKKDTKVPPPSGARVAYSNGSDVLLRGTPSLTGKKVGKLTKGQRIYIMYYSENYDEWRGTTANWAYVQTESGGRGWVFSPFVYY